MLTQRVVETRADQTIRAQLRDRAVHHVLANGLSDTSLRAIAEQLGTSHRMLIYHFGSSEEFWDAVLSGRMPTLEETWARVASSRNLPVIRLVFQIYGEALKDRTRFRTFLSQVVDSWLNTIASGLEKDLGVGRAKAKREARLRLAVIRGLLLDLLTTGDRPGTTETLREFARDRRASGWER